MCVRILLATVSEIHLIVDYSILNLGYGFPGARAEATETRFKVILQCPAGIYVFSQQFGPTVRGTTALAIFRALSRFSV